MKIINGTVYLDEIGGINTQGDHVTLAEATGTRLSLPLSVILRCHAIAKHECEKRGNDWEAEKERIMLG